VRYARNGDISLAYDVVGDGPLDLVLTTGWVLPMSAAWEQPRYTRFIERLAGFARVVMWDKRGTGMSDRVSPERLPTLEERADDLTAVLDAAGCERPALFGLSEGALVSALHAARSQDRVGALVLYGGWASSLPAGDSPGLMPAASWPARRAGASGWSAPSAAWISSASKKHARSRNPAARGCGRPSAAWTRSLRWKSGRTLPTRTTAARGG
jgi:pimeloyl-ACP methyl ester carboxylesterase